MTVLQSGISPGGTTTDSTTVTGVTAGSTIAVFLFNGSNFTPVTFSVSDTPGGAYTAGVATINDPSDFVAGRLFYLQNVAAGSHVITGTVDTGNTVQFTYAELSSSAGASAVSGNNSSSQASPGTGANAVTSGSVPNAGSGAGILLGFSTDSASVTSTDEPNIGTGFTSVLNGTTSAFGAYRMESKVVSAAAAATFTAPTGTHTFLTFGIIVLDGSAAPPAGPPIMGTSIWMTA